MNDLRFPLRSTGRRTLGALLLLALALGASPAPAAESGVVNINTASLEELTRLPRVGSVVAARILEHREENGRFTRPDDLMLVRGIGEKTYELIRPYVTLTGNTTLATKVKGASASDAASEGDGRR